MIDGKPYRMLKRHLGANGLTPDEYRERYGLKSDYPMAAPSYLASRSETARRNGLERKSATDEVVGQQDEPPELALLRDETERGDTAGNA